eukprot:TRINITY_DN4741_c0_g1_i19.p1 TRINITY_DN4741_c0_g1~~TRINITY_DN4741_c0_g1_i19.p1  ORF type:complete len:204 (+),score=49.57 TRINITY_DN4741_c0_g1_i19:126-737(+)
MIRRPPRSTLSSSSAASDVYKRQVLGQLTTYRAQHGAWNSQVWQVAHFSTVGTSSPAAGHPPLVYSGWVHRRDYDLACNDAGVIHGNSSHISTIVVQLPPNSNVSRLGGEEVVPVPNHESGNASTTSTNQAPPNLPACNITLTLPITVASPPTGRDIATTATTTTTVHVPVYMSLFNLEHLPPQRKDIINAKQPSTVITAIMD